MEQPTSSSYSQRNFILFLVLSVAVLFGHATLVANLRARQQAQKAAAEKEEEQQEKPGAKPQAEKPAEKPEAKPAEKPQAAKPEAKPREKPGAEKMTARRWITLGSVDPDDPYRMLVTLSNQGAAVARIELSSPRYCDLEDRTGYLGHIVMEDDDLGTGCPVQVVGPGTPAAEAGLQVGDRITAVAGREIAAAGDLDRALARSKPDHSVELTVQRGGKTETLTATLARRPLEVVRPESWEPQHVVTGQRSFDAVRPEDNAPLSLLTTLQQVDDQKIPDDDDPANPTLDTLNQEIKGVDLRLANWTLVESDQQHAVFRHALADLGLEVTKTYRLAEVPEEAIKDNDWQPHKSYHLEFDIQVRNVGQKPRKLAYRLDGPSGLPHEGVWYASKVSFTWGAAGLRDVVSQREHTNAAMKTCSEIADKGMIELDQNKFPYQFLGVDAQYFSALLLPDEQAASEIERAYAIRVGAVEKVQKMLTNTSVRLVSKVQEVAPGKTIEGRFTLFAGPKKPALLSQYGAGDVVTYGWYGWVARPMTETLHFFYRVVWNYGIAIILLTVLVRLCMFPLSRKQALGAQKMQELQPEIKRIQEKYKKDVEGRTRAQQELFRKHNYNPLSGCLVLFIQLPIFIGLYRSLQVDIELRGAPLIAQAIRWCSNLAAPDMLFDWHWWMPDSFNAGQGMFYLGPYFNLLPILTIGLFIWQQKMFMPPPADEQAAVQQKVMKWMMVFMGVMFYKVASGLCIYFIASSLWGLAERRFLPKAKPAGDDAGGEGRKGRVTLRLSMPPDRDGAAQKRKKKRKR